MKTLRTKDSYRHFNSLKYDKVLENVNHKNSDDDIREAKYDKIYTASDKRNEQVYNFELHKMHEESRRKFKTRNDNKPISLTRKGNMRQYNFKEFKPKPVVRRVKREDEDKCDKFALAQGKKRMSHPVNMSSRSGFYYASADCTTTIYAG